MSESYILCEGYHDRAFWGGLLLHLNCADPGALPSGKRRDFRDPFGNLVRGYGVFGFRSRSGAFIRVVPAHGKDNIPSLARNRLEERKGKALTRLVINVDSDQQADGGRPIGPTLTFQALEALVKEFDGAAKVNADGDIEM